MDKTCRILATVLGLLTLSACAADPPPYPDQADTRVLMPPPEPIAMARGGVGDSILMLPGSGLDIRDGRVVVFDHGPMAVEAFNSEAELLWTVGSKGEGPMEFLEHVIISLDGDGRTWIYDGGQRSLRSIEADGRMRAPTPARTISEGATASSLVPLDDGRFLTVWPTHGETLSRPGSLDMEILERPWKGLRDHESLVNQLRVERIGGDSLVWAHVLGGGFQFAGLGEAFEHWIPFVERTPIPEVIAEETTYNGRSATLRRIGADTRAALSIAVAEDVLYVLFEGKTRHARHLVDRYEIPSGRYLGTWMLEEPARAIAADGDLFASIEGDVIPKLVIRRIPPRAASERPEQP